MVISEHCFGIMCSNNLMLKLRHKLLGKRSISAVLVTRDILN